MVPMLCRRNSSSRRRIARSIQRSAKGRVAWPAEFIQLVSCEAVPLAWRRIYTIAVYLYLRRSELRALQWDDLDLDHGIANVHRAMDRSQKRLKTTKSGETRRFDIEPELMPLLQVMAVESDQRDWIINAPHNKNWAEQLRNHLKVAGVECAELAAHPRAFRPANRLHRRNVLESFRHHRGGAPLA